MAVTPIDVPASALDGTSSKPIGEFSSCFAEGMAHSGRACAFSPSERGGTFTDFGAHNAAATYWLQVRDAGTGTRLRLFASADANAAAHAVEMVALCQ